MRIRENSLYLERGTFSDFIRMVLNMDDLHREESNEEIEMRGKKVLTLALIVVVVFVLASCGQEKEVTVYTSVDQIHSEPIFEAFEAKTGIKVKPVYDIEASKTVGLANRLLEEKERPVADVFWNGEVSQTMRLMDLGVVERTASSNSADADSYPLR